jgi:hypothetical protein
MSDQITRPMVDELPPEKLARKANLWLILGIILILCIIFFCCIVILFTLLGPAVGNVFSKILEQMTPVP